MLEQHTSLLQHNGFAESSLEELRGLQIAIDQFAIVAVTDQRGIILDVNERFCEISQYSREELIGQDHRMINSGYHSKTFMRDLWTTIAGGQIWNGVVRNRAKDGSFYWVDTTIVPQLNEHGKPSRYIAVRRDVTAQKQAETRLSEYARELETVAKVSAEAATNLDTEAVLWSAANLVKETFGRYHAHIYLLDDAGEMLVLAAASGEVGKQQVAAGHRIPLNRESSLVARAARTRRGFYVNDVNSEAGFMPNPLLPDTCAELAVPMLVGDTLIGVLDVQDDETGAFSDMAMQAKSALANQLAVAIQNTRFFQEAREQELFLLQVLDSLPVRVFWKDNDLNYMGCNRLFAQDAGKETPEDLIGGSDYDFFPANADLYRADDRAVIDSGASKLLIEEPQVTPDGSEIWLSTSKVVLRDLEGNVTGILGAYQDITARKQAEKQNDASRKRSEMLADVNAAFSKAQDEQETLAAVATLMERYNVSMSTLGYFENAQDSVPQGFELVAARSGDGQVLPLTVFPKTWLTVAEYPLIEHFVAQSSAPMVVSDAFSDPRFDEVIRDFLRTSQISAFIALPLYSAGEWVGSMTFAWDCPQNFDADLVSVLAEVMPTTTAVVARRRAQLAEEIAHRRSEMFAEVNAAFSKAQDEPEILAAVATLMERYGVTLSTLGYFENDTDAYRIMAARSGDGQFLPMSVFPSALLTASEYPLLNLVVRQPNQLLIAGDTVKDLAFDMASVQIMQALGTLAMIALPLYHAGEWLGTLTFTWDSPQHFDADLVSVMAELMPTATAVVARRRAQLDQQAATAASERRARDLATVATISSTVTTQLDLDAMLQQVVDLTKLDFGLYHAHVYLLDEDGTNLVLAAGAGDVGQKMRAHGHQIPVNREISLVARTARERRGVIVNDVTQEAGFMPNAMLPNTRAEMAVPMLVGAELVGVLDVQSEVTQRFTADDVNIYTTLAGQIAAAVKNANAYEFQRQTAERLREIDRLKSEFLANMSHELRTPLNSIIGYSQVLLNGGDGDLSEEALLDVDDIHSSGQHLLSIINDILDLAKIEAGQMQMHLEMVNLEHVVEDAVRTSQILVKEKPVELRLEVDSRIRPVTADRLRLRQVVLNLISNAVKFTEAGSVTVHLGMENPDEVYVRIVDTGVGIKPEHLALIFEQFQQVDGSSTRRIGGTGLGLTITRHLIHMHGGDIHVESAFGAGSTFWFTVPVSSEALP